MLALLIYAYANGVFSSRRIERATYRDIGMRFVAAFLHVLELARETGLMRLGTVSIDGMKIDANASKYRSIRYDRAKELRETLATDIAILMERAETADTTDTDHQALPEELARREALKAKLDEACARLEAEAREQARTARPADERAGR